MVNVTIYSSTMDPMGMENMMEQFYTADVPPFKMENDDPGDHTHVLFLSITESMSLR